MKNFTYKPRSRFQWLVRAKQTRNSVHPPASSPPAPRPAPPAPMPPTTPTPTQIEIPDDEESSESRVSAKKVKLTQATRCICGHQHGDHHTEPTLHSPESGAFYCISKHCSCSVRVGMAHTLLPCPCEHFRATATGEPKLTRPKCVSWTPCGACGHPRGWHCTKRTSKKPEPYQGFTTEDGVPYVCSHFDQAANPVSYRCTSNACAVSEDGKTFCSCKKFINPFLRRRAKSTTTPRAKRVKAIGDPITAPMPVEECQP